MKFWMHGIFGSVLAGALWSVVWQIVATMALIVSTGAGLSLQIGPAVLAGASAGPFAILFRSESTVLRHICGVLAMGVLIWGFSLGAPYDPKAILPAWQSWLTLVIAAGTGWFSIACLLYTSPSPRDKRQSRMPSSA